MKEDDLPAEFVAKCKTITARRARTVIDHVLKNGFITSEELKVSYGYNHPPRAIRDVKENGIPMEMFRVTGSDGRKIGAYRFGDPAKIRGGRFSGRTSLGKRLRDALIARDGARCAIYRETFQVEELQIDHRIPFEVSGEDPATDRNPDHYMLLCASANRAKSWSCEHCRNWIQIRSTDICTSCYWAYPDDYEHVAMKAIRRLDLIWVAGEAAEFEAIKEKAESAGLEMPSFVKDVLRRVLG